MSQPSFARRGLFSLGALRAALGADPQPAPRRAPPLVSLLQHAPPPASAPRTGGRAVIAVYDCLAHRGTTCSTCVERCPVPGAIRLVAGRPVVEAASCTGCGVCQEVCPSPRNAVIIAPAPRRGGVA